MACSVSEVRRGTRANWLYQVIKHRREFVFRERSQGQSASGGAQEYFTSGACQLTSGGLSGRQVTDCHVRFDVDDSISCE